MPAAGGGLGDDGLPGSAGDGGCCATCGATVEVRPPTWSLQVGPRGATWLCDGCTRRNLRAIEGRLDEAWW